LRIIAADSSAAILDDHFDPLTIVAMAAVLVEPPYKEVSSCLVEPLFIDVKEGPFLIVHELRLCQRLLERVTADVVHLDMSLGGMSLEELSVVQFSKMRISNRGRKHILKILPQVRKISSDIKRVYGIDVLAIGKESIPVRIAELTSGAYAVLYSAQKVVKERRRLRLGLPAKCRLELSEDAVKLQSLAPVEYDIAGYVKDEDGILHKVKISEMPNPCARGFRVLEFVPEAE